MNPSRATIPLIRPHQCDSEGGRIRGVLLYFEDSEWTQCSVSCRVAAGPDGAQMEQTYRPYSATCTHAHQVGKGGCPVSFIYMCVSGWQLVSVSTVVPATAGHRWFRGKVALRGRWPLVTGNGHMRHYVKSNTHIRQHIFHSTCTTI